MEEKAEELTTRNTELEASLASLRSQNAELASTNESLRKEFDNYRNDCEDVRSALDNVQQILAEEEDNLRRVEEKLTAGLTDFANRGVDVYFRGGLLYVSMTDQLLYKSGSATLEDQGKKALQSLAAVLNDYPNLKVIVVGNTDDVQFKGGTDNWTLSTERANGVVRLLNEEFKVDASRLTSAGRGKYNPLADNGTEEGRAKNRRTDIILNPDIDRIWDSAKNNN